MPTDLAAAGLPVFTGGIILGAMVVFAAVAWGIHYGRRTAAAESSVELHAEQVLKMLQGVSRFATGIAGDVSEHQEHYHRILERLQEAESRPEPLQPETAIAMVREMVSMHDEFKKRLDEAEISLKKQAEAIEGYATEARTDSLTGLPNRRAFDDDLTARFAQWRRYRTPLSVMMIDIDHFKKFNDTHGHLAGDAVLTQVAEVLRNSLRRSDVIARFGGEEFSVILPNTSAIDGGVAASNMNHAIRDTVFDYEGKSMRVTVSCGVADAQPGDTAITLVKRADEALYAAKNAGRNCVQRHTGDRIERGDPAPEIKTAEAPAGSSMKQTTREFTQVCDDLRRRLLEVASGEKP